MNLNKLLDRGINNIGRAVLKNSIKNEKEKAFFLHLNGLIKAASARRKALTKAGIHVPLFLIASIASKCNLHCKGCYARSNGNCKDEISKDDLTNIEWENVFIQARNAGVLFTLLAGGEPLMRKDVIEKAALCPDIVFPIFTNGTMIDEEYLQLFDNNRNLIPILSIEGSNQLTDERRGQGLSAIITNRMKLLQENEIFYGCSVTVTKENADIVTSSEFIENLKNKGCGIIFYIEYVPVEKGSENLSLDDEFRLVLEKNIVKLRKKNKKMFFISFPGDEKYLGGCLAAGRGFFHINPTGGAEPCPFSPFSDTTLKKTSFIEALSSPLFSKIRSNQVLLQEHSGGCVLFENEETVKDLIK